MSTIVRIESLCNDNNVQIHFKASFQNSKIDSIVITWTNTRRLIPSNCYIQMECLAPHGMFGVSLYSLKPILKKS